jgi:lactoylglutathione lyase
MKLIGISLLLAVTALAQPARPRITGVAHIAIWVHDMEKSRAFYHDFLGFDEVYSLPGNNPLTFWKISERQYIEMFPEQAANTDRLYHISLETDNAEALRAYLKSKGVAVPDAVHKNRIGNTSYNIKDPEGHIVEITQYEPTSWTAREKGNHLPATRISSRMTHVGFVVTNFDAETKFYTEILGFKETWRGSGSKSGTQLSWTNLKVPDGDDYIEFMLYKQAPEETKRGDANHLCLEVPDINAALATLNARPYRKEYQRPLEAHVGVNRKRIVNIFDPDGTRIELMEPATIDGKPAPSSNAPPPR